MQAQVSLKPSSRMGLGENVGALMAEFGHSYADVAAGIGAAPEKGPQALNYLVKNRSKRSAYAPALAVFYKIDLELLVGDDSLACVQQARNPDQRGVRQNIERRSAKDSGPYVSEILTVVMRLSSYERSLVLAMAEAIEAKSPAYDAGKKSPVIYGRGQRAQPNAPNTETGEVTTRKGIDGKRNRVVERTGKRSTTDPK